VPLGLEHLRLLDRFHCHYDRERPHDGIGNQPPADRSTPSAPLGELQLAEDEKSPPYPQIPPPCGLKKFDSGRDGRVGDRGRTG
jgi:hypothetical protein